MPRHQAYSKVASIICIIRRRALLSIGGIKLPQIELLHTIPQKPGKVTILHPLIDGYRQQMQLATVGFVKPAAHVTSPKFIQIR